MDNGIALIINLVLLFTLIVNNIELSKSIEEVDELTDVIVDLKEDICILEDRVFDLEEYGKDVQYED